MNDKITISNGIVKIPEGAGNINVGRNEKIYFFEADAKNPFFSNDEYGVLFNKDKTKLIQGVYGLGNYRIPFGVKEIGSNAFNYNGAWDVHITIPEGVEHICDEALMLISDDIILPESIKSLGRSFCCGSFTVGKNVSHIAEGVSVYSNPVRVDPENPYFTIYDDALCSKDMTRLLLVFSNKEKYIIPDGVRRVDEAALFGNDAIRELHIPASVEYLGDSFIHPATEAVYVSHDNKYFCDEDGILYNKDRSVLIRYPSCRRGDYHMPNSVRKIGLNAFLDAKIDRLYLSNRLENISTLQFDVNEICFPDNYRYRTR